MMSIVLVPGDTYETVDGRVAICLSVLPNDMRKVRVEGHDHVVVYRKDGFYWDVNRMARNQLWRIKGAL